MADRSHRLTIARRRALMVLLRAPEGHTEAAMMAHGFSLQFLTDLVRDGLVNESADRLRIRKREVEVVRLSITGEGRQALDG
jgi:hypothetical protein